MPLISPRRSSVDIEALAARVSDPGFWHSSMKEEDDEGPNLCSFCLLRGWALIVIFEGAAEVRPIVFISKAIIGELS